MTVPHWALQKVGQADRQIAETSLRNGTAKVVFSDRKSLKKWIKYRNWKTRWLFFESSFFKKLFESDENFQLALSDKVIEIWVPKSSHRISEEEFKDIDQEYKLEKWDTTVETLSNVRRAIDAGVMIKIGDKKFSSSGSFYNWASNRYPLLEESSDKWILNGP